MLTIQDIVVIYSAVLSTATAGVGGTRWYRRKKVEISFSYGWSETREEYARLTVRVHNDSPLAAVHLLQVGWKDDGGKGDWWSPPTGSVLVEAGATYAHDFEILTAPTQAIGYVMLGDRTMRDGFPFDVKHMGISKAGDGMSLTSDEPQRRRP